MAHHGTQLCASVSTLVGRPLSLDMLLRRLSSGRKCVRSALINWNVGALRGPTYSNGSACCLRSQEVIEMIKTNLPGFTAEYSLPRPDGFPYTGSLSAVEHGVLPAQQISTGGGGGWRCWFIWGCYICCNNYWCWYVCRGGAASLSNVAAR